MGILIQNAQYQDLETFCGEAIEDFVVYPASGQSFTIDPETITGITFDVWKTNTAGENLLHLELGSGVVIGEGNINITAATPNYNGYAGGATYRLRATTSSGTQTLVYGSFNILQ